MLSIDYPGEASIEPKYWTEERRHSLCALQQDGVAYAASKFNERQMENINSWFSTRLVYNAHVRAKATACAVQDEAIKDKRWPMFCVDMRDAVLAPGLFELMVDHYGFARTYFGEQPILYSMNAFWTQPAASGELYQDTHEWHRDLDDRKQLVIFVYGTDVATRFGDGAHLYQIGTHLVEDSALGRHVRAPPPHVVREITGKAGTVFLSNTRGLHMGCRPNKPRMLAWGRWGVSRPPESYRWDQLQPTDKKLLGDRYPVSPEIQDAISFVVR